MQIDTVETENSLHVNGAEILRFFGGSPSVLIGAPGAAAYARRWCGESVDLRLRRGEPIGHLLRSPEPP